MSLIKRIWIKTTSLGLLGSLHCLSSRLYMTMLQKRFGFAKWHATAPFSCRPYKQKVIDIIHSLNARGVVEIGCGLGDIGRQLQKTDEIDYHGIDLESAALSGARFLAGKESSLTFQEGSFEQIENLPPGNFDILLLLNWAHEIDTKSLSDMMTANIGKDIRYVLPDSIQQHGNTGFRYHHTAEKLIENGFPFRLKDVVKELDDVRDLMVFER